MKKKILMRGLFGLPTGIAIGFVITLIISICIGNGSFYPVTPELIDATGNELNAVILQTVLCAIMGAGFAAASIIWELDSWSLAKQSGIYFMIISVIMLPIAYFTNWMKHTVLAHQRRSCGGAGVSISAPTIDTGGQILLVQKLVDKVVVFLGKNALGVIQPNIVHKAPPS